MVPMFPVMMEEADLLSGDDDMLAGGGDMVYNHSTVSSFISSCDSHSRWISGNDVVCNVGCVEGIWCLVLQSVVLCHHVTVTAGGFQVMM